VSCLVCCVLPCVLCPGLCDVPCLVCCVQPRVCVKLSVLCPTLRAVFQPRYVYEGSDDEDFELADSPILQRRGAPPTAAAHSGGGGASSSSSSILSPMPSQVMMVDPTVDPDLDPDIEQWLQSNSPDSAQGSAFASPPTPQQQQQPVTRHQQQQQQPSRDRPSSQPVPVRSVISAAWGAPLTATANNPFVSAQPTSGPQRSQPVPVPQSSQAGAWGSSTDGSTAWAAARGPPAGVDVRAQA
jgi:hypothetical protein